MNSFDPITRSKPIAEQVQDLLRARIQGGSYSPDERMPSEERLARDLHVSRATVRTALAALTAEGLVRRRHGDGTYPTPNALELTVRASEAWNIERQIQKGGRTPSIQVLEQGIRPPSPQESQGLALENEAQVYTIRRVFFADDLPVMLAIHIVRGQGLAPDSLAEALQLPLLEFLTRHHPHPPKGGEAHFKAILADADIAGNLQLEPGSPLLLLEAVLRDDQDDPMLLAWEYYRGEEGFLLPVAPFHF